MKGIAGSFYLIGKTALGKHGNASEEQQRQALVKKMFPLFPGSATAIDRFQKSVTKRKLKKKQAHPFVDQTKKKEDVTEPSPVRLEKAEKSSAKPIAEEVTSKNQALSSHSVLGSMLPSLSHVLGGKQLKERMKTIKQERKTLKNEIKKLTSKKSQSDLLEIQKKEKKRDELTTLYDELQRKHEILQHQSTQLRGKLVNLLTNIRSFYKDKTSQPILDIGRLDLPDGVTIKNARLQLKNVHIENEKHNPVVEIELGLNNIEIEALIRDNVLPVCAKVSVNPIMIRLEGEVAQMLTKYLTVGKLGFPTALAGIAKHMASLIKKQKEKKYDENVILPHGISIQLGKMDAAIQNIDTSLISSEAKKEPILPALLSSLLPIPLQTQIKIQECDIKLNDQILADQDEKSLQGSIHLEGMNLEYNAQQSEMNQYEKSAQLALSCDAVDLSGKQVIPVVSHITELLLARPFDFNIPVVHFPINGEVDDHYHIELSKPTLEANFDVKENSNEKWELAHLPEISFNTDKLGVEGQITNQSLTLGVTGSVHDIDLQVKNSGKNSQQISLNLLEKNQVPNKVEVSLDQSSDSLTKSDDYVVAAGKLEVDVAKGSHYEATISQDEKKTLIKNSIQLPECKVEVKEDCLFHIGENREILKNMDSSFIRFDKEKQCVALPAHNILAINQGHLDFNAELDQQKCEIAADFQCKAIALGNIDTQRTGMSSVLHDCKGGIERNLVFGEPTTESLQPTLIMNNLDYSLSDLDIAGFHLDRLSLNADENLNGEVLLKNLTFSPEKIVADQERGRQERLPIPRILRFFMKNKTVHADLKAPIKGGRVNLNHLVQLDVSVEVPRNASRLDKVITGILNRSLRLISSSSKRKLFNIKAKNNKMEISSSLYKKFRLRVPHHIASKISKESNMDQQGWIHIPSLLQNSTGFTVLTQSDKNQVDGYLRNILDDKNREQVAYQEILDNPSKRPLAIYFLKKLPWKELVQKAKDTQDQKLQQQLIKWHDMLLSDKGALMQGVRLYQIVDRKPTAAELNGLLERVKEEKLDTTSVAQLLLKFGDEASHLKAEQCFLETLEEHPEHKSACISYVHMKLSDNETSINNKILGFIERAAMFGDQRSYQFLESMASQNKDLSVQLIMLRVHLFYNQKHREGSATPLTAEQHSMAALKIWENIMVLEDSPEKREAYDLMIKRCQYAHTMRNVVVDDMDEKKQRLQDLQAKQSNKLKNLSLSTEQIFEAAMDCTFCLHGQDQDLHLATYLLENIQDKDPRAAHYAQIVQEQANL